jgi:hypothetical protein
MKLKIRITKDVNVSLSLSIDENCVCGRAEVDTDVRLVNIDNDKQTLHIISYCLPLTKNSAKMLRQDHINGLKIYHF